MPELPEVETVRRGLQPVMEGARFTKVEAHRGDLRWPLSKDFVARLEGKTVEGLGRRAKYLLVDLSSGEVLLMHLGMSGRFALQRRVVNARPVAITMTAPRTPSTITWCFTCPRARGFLHDPRRFGMMKLVRARASSTRSHCCVRLGPSR